MHFLPLNFPKRAQHLLVTPGSIPLHLTPWVSDPDQLLHSSSVLHLRQNKESAAFSGSSFSSRICYLSLT